MIENYLGVKFKKLPDGGYEMVQPYLVQKIVDILQLGEYVIPK